MCRSVDVPAYPLDYHAAQNCRYLSGGKTVLEERAALVRCACGYGISVELSDEGARICNVMLFDNEPSSDSHGERVRECPGCGVGLGLHTLITLEA